MISGIFKSDGRPLDWRWLEQQLLFIGIVIGLPLGIGTAPTIFRDGDVSWHVAAGNWIMKHWPFRPPIHSRLQPPATRGSQPSGFRKLSRPQRTISLAMRVSRRLTAAALIALNAIVFFHLQRRGAALPWAKPAGNGRGACADGDGASARTRLDAARGLDGASADLRGQRPAAAFMVGVAACPLDQSPHEHFPLAAPIGAAIAFDSLIEAKWKNLGNGCCSRSQASSRFSQTRTELPEVLQPFRISGLDMLGVIGEWSPTTTHNTPEFFVILLLGLAALLLRGVRVPIGRLILLLATLGMAFIHMRHQSSFIILAACVIPPLIPALQRSKTVAAPLMLAALPFLLVRALLPLTPPESQSNPRRLIAAVPPELRRQPVFNGYSLGGPLILAGESALY